MLDNINPKHYRVGNIEVIDFIEDKQLNFHRANAVKYITRAGVKNAETEIEDLRKAIWYLDREIRRLEKEDFRANLDDCSYTTSGPGEE